MNSDQTRFSKVDKRQRPSLSKLCPHLFSGELKTSDIVEVYGSPGSGKSMICLDILMNAILPENWNGSLIGGIDTKAILIDCDGHFNILHFSNMIERKLTKLYYLEQIEGSRQKMSKAEFKQELEKLMESCMRKLIIVQCPFSHDFDVTLMTIDKVIAGASDVSLIIVDSLSAFYWYDRAYRFQSWTSMESHMNKVLERFCQITKRYQILTIASVNDLFSKSKIRIENDLDKYQFLGKDWNNKVTIRITPRTERLSDSKKECHVTVTTKEKEKETVYTFHEDGLHPLLY